MTAGNGGTRNRRVFDASGVPVIAGGGIGNIRHVVEALLTDVWTTIKSGLPAGTEESPAEPCCTSGKRVTPTMR